MKQQWIAVAAVLPKTVAESDVQIHVQQLIAAGLDAKYLDTVPTRGWCSLHHAPPVTTPTPEGSWVVFVGPVPQPARTPTSQCPLIIAAQGSVDRASPPSPTRPDHRPAEITAG